MADSPTPNEHLNRIRQNQGAKQVFAEFLRERLLAKQEAFTRQTRDTFDVHKGRCLELQDLLNDILK